MSAPCNYVEATRAPQCGAPAEWDSKLQRPLCTKHRIHVLHLRAMRDADLAVQRARHLRQQRGGQA